jgi:polymorphic toxin system DSP-PTPase phosphatase-like protein
VLVRSAQPNYGGPVDEKHSLQQADVDFLLHHRIACVISANRYVMSEAGRTLLDRARILYKHLRVGDFGTPTTQTLLSVAELIQQHPATLVYCGYGQGRTGTYVAAWARLHRGLSRFDLEYLNGEFGVETPGQADSIARLSQ